MNLLSVEGVSKSYGERIIFEPISFGISKGQKIAFIAKNGSGKTNILEGLSLLEKGRGFKKDKVINFFKPIIRPSVKMSSKFNLNISGNYI